MNNLQHPSELNAYHIYKQANLIAKSTTRAKNSDWYEQAYSIQRQWHLWVDRSQVLSCLFDRVANRWVEGPQVSWLEEIYSESEDNVAEGLSFKRTISAEKLEELHSSIAEVLRSRELGGKVSSLGIVLHMADEFAILDPSREFSSNGDFEEVRSALLVNPQEVLGDSTADPLLSTWHVIPFWGAKEGRRNVLVQLSRGMEDFFSAVRDYGDSNNIAIVAAGVSAPLEMLQLAPVYLEWGQERGRGDIIVLLYRDFSVLAVLDGEGELVLLRSLTHRGGANYPAGLGEILLNTQTSIGLENPVVTIVPMSSGPAQKLLTEELTAFFLRKTPMDIGFCELDQIDFFQNIPDNRAEMALGDDEGLSALLEGNDLYENTTFTGLSAGWGTQDFFPVPFDESEKYPDWGDLQLRKWFGLVKGVLLAGVISLAIFFGIKYMEASATEGWNATPEELAANTTMTELLAEKREMDFWQDAMAKRSEGWQMMELLLQLYPENKGIVITRCQYAVRADRSTSKGEKKKKTGFIKVWEIKGHVTPQALPYLTKLGSSGTMRENFNDMAKKHGASQYDMQKPGRTMNVTLQRKQGVYNSFGAMTKEEAATYNTEFTLGITQRFSAEDEMAIPVKTK